MRAEVGLLTRNIKFTGDAASEDDEYGPHMYIHSDNEEYIQANIHNVEFKNVGQPYKLGRHPIFFNAKEKAHKSSIKGCSIHNSFSRGVALKKVKYL